MDFQNTLSKLLGNDKSIKEVQIDQKVIDEIVKIAINADPKEYVALLSGNIKKDILKITGLIFLPFEASDTSAVMQVFMMPMTTNAVGSVHSHPGPSAQPSNADLTFFGKNGYFHMIICRPYSVATIKSYDVHGNPVPFVVKDLGEEVEIKQWDDLDIDKELFDEDFIKEMNNLESDEKNDTDLDTDEKEEEEIMKDKKPVEPELIQPQSPGTINLEFEMNGKMYNEELPLPPEYEPGDELEVDIRTDQTPNDDIDEIILNVKKAPQNVRNITYTGSAQKIEKAKSESSNEKQIQQSSQKSSEEIEAEIKQMEDDIAKLKKENERLKNNL
ncbi:MAG: Mov34/MPN/PAD-1 family protein [Methanosphaera sp.]|nr:Mov34/MPN/PAD-1 family protein [Methanosphaera sp.]